MAVLLRLLTVSHIHKFVISKDCDDKQDIPNRRSSFILIAYVNNIICRLHLDCLVKVTLFYKNVSSSL